MPRTVNLHFQGRLFVVSRQATRARTRAVTDQAWLATNVNTIAKSIVTGLRARNARLQAQNQPPDNRLFDTNIGPYPESEKVGWIERSILSGALTVHADIAMDPVEGKTDDGSGGTIKFALSPRNSLPNYLLTDDATLLNAHAPRIGLIVATDYHDVDTWWGYDVSQMNVTERQDFVVNAINMRVLFVHIYDG